MRVTVLCYVESEGSTEVDIVATQVAEELTALGHDVNILGIHADVEAVLAALRATAPDIVFNLAEMFGDNMQGEIAVVGLLELLNIPYTGGGPGEFYLQQDKGLAKKLLAFHDVKYPDYAVFAADASLETGGKLRLPLFVKPLRADASIGIDAGSLCRTSTELMKRVVFIHEELKDSALAEEYIEGREFYVGVLGNNDPVAFPPIEMDFSKLDEGLPRIADSKAKWEEGSREFAGTESVLVELPDEARAKLQKAAVEAYRALRVRDYGRIDFRVNEAGEIYVIEVNASCYLEKGSEFATAAAAMGIDYRTLIGKILDLALERAEQHGKRMPSNHASNGQAHGANRLPYIRT